MEERFDTYAGFHQAIDKVFAAANRELLIFDQDLKSLELGSPARIDLLSAFFAGHRERRLRLVVHNPALLLGHLPRLGQVLIRNSIQAALRRTPDHLAQLADSLIIGDDSSAAIRFHRDHARGKLLLAAPEEIAPTASVSRRCGTNAANLSC